MAKSKKNKSKSKRRRKNKVTKNKTKSKNKSGNNNNKMKTKTKNKIHKNKNKTKNKKKNKKTEARAITRRRRTRTIRIRQCTQWRYHKHLKRFLPIWWMCMLHTITTGRGVCVCEAHLETRDGSPLPRQPTRLWCERGPLTPSTRRPLGPQGSSRLPRRRLPSVHWHWTWFPKNGWPALRCRETDTDTMKHPRSDVNLWLQRVKNHVHARSGVLFNALPRLSLQTFLKTTVALTVGGVLDFHQGLMQDSHWRAKLRVALGAS